MIYEVEFNHDETDHVLGNLCILADLCNDRMVPKTMCQCTQVCPLCRVQNMVGLIVVEFYFVETNNKGMKTCAKRTRTKNDARFVTEVQKEREMGKTHS